MRVCVARSRRADSPSSAPGRFAATARISKPESVYAVQRATEVTYKAPLRWDEGATVAVRTLTAGERGFDQEFEIRSAADDRPIARFVHHWVWFDTEAERPVPLSDDDRRKLLEDGS